MQPGVVIVGGGQAGLEAAAALRTQGYEGAVTLICEEAHAPYQRPPLSKDFLTGKQDADSVFLRAAGMPVYVFNGIAYDVDDDRSHGKDERIAIASFDPSLEFDYRLPKAP